MQLKPEMKLTLQAHRPLAPALPAPPAPPAQAPLAVHLQIPVVTVMVMSLFCHKTIGILRMRGMRRT